MSKQYFADASRARVQITSAQARSIRGMYSDLAAEIAAENKRLSGKSNISSILRKQYLDALSSQIKVELDNISKIQEYTIRKNMASVASAIVADNTILLKNMGINITGAYSFVPTDVVKEIASGKLYEGRWSLNAAIWGNNAKTKRDIDYIVAKGVAGQKGTLEIAKDLEKYVNPAKRKDFKWSKVYPGSSKVVDYNAQRLARTMVSHAYQDSLVRTTRDNPFVECYRWMTSNSDRVCDICISRSEDFHGVIINGKPMDGCYYASDIPLDHPNGMCTVDVVIEADFNAIGSRLADWVNGKEDDALDNFAVSMGYEPRYAKSKVTSK